MKKTMMIGLALGVVAITATSAFAVITGSKHDLSVAQQGVTPGADAQDRICIYCHHPHNTVKAADIQGTFQYSPLWNRDVPASSRFSIYNNSAGSTNMMGDTSSSKHMMNGTPAVGGVSLLCMSCHDGVTALNAYSDNNTFVGAGSTAIATGSTQTGTMATNTITGVASFGNDLSNHHPIGMVWSEVLGNGTTTGDDEIAATSATFANTSITIGSVLTGGVMECSSCHDVHNGTSAERFLWTTNNSSAFCLSCHLK